MSSSIDLYFVGDPHGKTRDICERIAASQPKAGSAAFFLGDLCLDRPFDETVKDVLDLGMQAYWIHGNHDTDEVLYWQNLCASAGRSASGRVIELCGIRVAGLGGIFRSEIWLPGQGKDGHAFYGYADYLDAAEARRPKRLRGKTEDNKRDLRHCSSIFPEAYNRLAAQRADILITHEGVSDIQGGFLAIDELANCMGVKKLFFGHHHATHHFGVRPGIDFDAYCVGEADYIVLPGIGGVKSLL